MSDDAGFDTQAAWLRRFTTDAESNLHAFARRLQEALPGQVSVRESRGLFARNGKTTGVTIEVGDNRYALDIAGGRLRATIAIVARGITLNTKAVDPAEWFKRLAEETGKATEQAKVLSQSLSAFMGS